LGHSPTPPTTRYFLLDFQQIKEAIETASIANRERCTAGHKTAQNISDYG